MAEAMPSVIVIDDDSAIRESIGALLRSVGLQANLFASVDEFLKAGRPDGPACLVLDVQLPIGAASSRMAAASRRRGSQVRI
jgi:FixJ family two-component response regulator